MIVRVQIQVTSYTCKRPCNIALLILGDAIQLIPISLSLISSHLLNNAFVICVCKKELLNHLRQFVFIQDKPIEFWLKY